jgi:hypothetical protein
VFARLQGGFCREMNVVCREMNVVCREMNVIVSTSILPQKPSNPRAFIDIRSLSGVLTKKQRGKEEPPSAGYRAKYFFSRLRSA